MRSYPEHIKTKQDMLNIFNNHPDMHGALKDDLLRMLNEPITAEQVVSYDINPETKEMINIVTKTITRPNQTWKRMGFASRKEFAGIIAKLKKPTN